MKMKLCPATPSLKKLMLSAGVMLALSPTVFAQNMFNNSGSTSTSTSANNGNAMKAQIDDGEVEPTTRKSSSSLPRITSGRTGATAAMAPERNVSQVRREPGEFEKYIKTVTGKELPIFGANLFADVPSTFAPGDAAQVNQDYVLGAGDSVQIRGWGMIDIDVNATVDRSGAIYIPRVGNVNVSGVKYRDLQGYLKQAVSKVFTNFELTASISQVRSVQIYVVGHAVRPGTYTLSAMSTLLNALFTSGGPDVTGSMRNIEVKRGNQTITRFDMYDMLVKGDKSRDVTLQDGDVVYIPEVGPLVGLVGNVKKPAIFELKSASANAAELVGWAGGFESAAQTKQVVVEKNTNNDFQTVATLTADQASIDGNLAQIPVAPADVIRVYAPGAVPIEALVSNGYVRVSGAVKQSGVFKLNPGETLRSFISRLGGTRENAYVYGTELNRESVREMQQEKLNQVAERFSRDLETSARQQLSSTSDAGNVTIIMAAVERQRAIAQRMATIKAKGRIVLEMEDGNAQVKNLPEVALRDGDSIFVPVRPDTVEVLGAVFQQNTFIYRPSRQVGDYLTLAGGASQTSDVSQMYVIRADGTAVSRDSSGWFSGLKSTKVNPGDTIVVPEEVVHTSWAQSLKEWTSIFYQFGLGAAGLKVLKD